VQRYTAERLGRPRLLANPVTGSVGAFECRQQTAPLVVSRKKFDHSRQFHSLSVAQIILKLNALKGGSLAFLTGINPGVSGE
jgi:hypothetical protein